LVAAAPPQKPKQAPPSPSRSEKKASKEESKASKVAKADKPPEPAETRGGRYQVRLSGPSRKVDLPVDEKTPEPSKSQQDEAAALDAADYDGRRDSGGSRRLFGKRSSKEDEETAAGDESKPRRGLFRGRKGDGDLVAGGRGVIETTLFGD
jgi:type IV secretory pathway VirB10-like protein